jgi:hypothetical protein
MAYNLQCSVQCYFIFECYATLLLFEGILKALKREKTSSEKYTVIAKAIKIILRLFLVIAMYCQGSSRQIKSITQPLPLLAGWEGSLGTCSR